MAGLTGAAPARRRRRRILRPVLLTLLTVFVLIPAALSLAFRVVPPPVTPLMVIRLLEGDGARRDWVPLGDISAELPAAVAAAEDNRYCQHAGFDWVEVEAAWRQFQSDGRIRGASTLSMQVARNLFLWPGRTAVRKALEAWLTPIVELALGKRRLMEVYLNIVEWGPGIFGAEAAARHHFGKAAADLTARESALLAALLPNPREWKPGQGYVQRRADVIRGRVEDIRPLLDCL
jgi:monofunctional biosynthetic peptidoglycan transglycosylase